MEFTDIIKTVAPWIGTALGGPLGGMAVEAAAGALGLSTKTTDSLKQALSGVTPEQMLALKQADQNFQLQMQALGFKQVTDLEKISADDRASARQMQISKPSPLPAMLSVGVTAGFFGILVANGAGWLQAHGNESYAQMLGQLSTGWVAIMAYWFGTTRDSARKTDLLAQSTPNA